MNKLFGFKCRDTSSHLSVLHDKLIKMEVNDILPSSVCVRVLASDIKKMNDMPVYANSLFKDTILILYKNGLRDCISGEFSGTVSNLKNFLSSFDELYTKGSVSVKDVFTENWEFMRNVCIGDLVINSSKGTTDYDCAEMVRGECFYEWKVFYDYLVCKLKELELVEFR